LRGLFLRFRASGAPKRTERRQKATAADACALSAAVGGAGATYPTITSAVSALAVGVSGPVVFNINQGTYTEKFYVGAISGVSSTNTVTFKSTLNDSTSVIITDASSTTSVNNYTVGFIGASYVTFKSLTIQRTGTNN